MTTRHLRFTPAQARRACGLWTSFAVICLCLVASTAFGETLSSYNSWQWNGFTRTTSPSSHNTASQSSSSSSLISAGSSLTNPVTTIISGASLAGTIYYDVDADGVRDSTDWAIRYANVSLSLAGSTATSTYRTGKDGAYTFAGLNAGTYTVTLTTVSDSGGTTSAGTINGTADTTAIRGAVTISEIVLATDAVAINYDFAQYAYPICLISKQLLMADDPGIEHTDPVPEPNTLALFSVAGLLLVGFAWRRRLRNLQSRSCLGSAS